MLFLCQLVNDPTALRIELSARPVHQQACTQSDQACIHEGMQSYTPATEMIRKGQV